MHSSTIAPSHRELLGELCRLSYETVHDLMSAATGEDVRPGFVAVVQTHGSNLGWNPHIHALATRGGWTRGHEWVPLAYVDSRAAELAFRHKVLRCLLTKRPAAGAARGAPARLAAPHGLFGP